MWSHLPLLGLLHATWDPKITRSFVKRWKPTVASPELGFLSYQVEQVDAFCRANILSVSQNYSSIVQMHEDNNRFHLFLHMDGLIECCLWDGLLDLDSKGDCFIELNKWYAIRFPDSVLQARLKNEDKQAWCIYHDH